MLLQNSLNHILKCRKVKDYLVVKSIYKYSIVSLRARWSGLAMSLVMPDRGQVSRISPTSHAHYAPITCM